MIVFSLRSASKDGQETPSQVVRNREEVSKNKSTSNRDERRPASTVEGHCVQIQLTENSATYCEARPTPEWSNGNRQRDWIFDGGAGGDAFPSEHFNLFPGRPFAQWPPSPTTPRRAHSFPPTSRLTGSAPSGRRLPSFASRPFFDPPIAAAGVLDIPSTLFPPPFPKHPFPITHPLPLGSDFAFFETVPQKAASEQQVRAPDGPSSNPSTGSSCLSTSYGNSEEEVVGESSRGEEILSSEVVDVKQVPSQVTLTISLESPAAPGGGDVCANRAAISSRTDFPLHPVIDLHQRRKFSKHFSGSHGGKCGIRRYQKRNTLQRRHDNDLPPAGTKPADSVRSLGVASSCRRKIKSNHPIRQPLPKVWLQKKESNAVEAPGSNSGEKLIKTGLNIDGATLRAEPDPPTVECLHKFREGKTHEDLDEISFQDDLLAGEVSEFLDGQLAHQTPNRKLNKRLTLTVDTVDDESLPRGAFHQLAGPAGSARKSHGKTKKSKRQRRELLLETRTLRLYATLPRRSIGVTCANSKSSGEFARSELPLQSDRDDWGSKFHKFHTGDSIRPNTDLARSVSIYYETNMT